MTTRLTGNDPDFAVWKSVSGETFRVRTRTNGKPDTFSLAKMTVSALAEMARGGDPYTVMDCFAVELRDADGKIIWPVKHADRKPAVGPAPKKRRATKAKASEAVA
jgi:hypothetical protein